MSGCAHSMTLSTANHNHHLSFSSYHHHRLRADMPRPAVVVRYVAATIGVAAASYTFYRVSGTRSILIRVFQVVGAYTRTTTAPHSSPLQIKYNVLTGAYSILFNFCSSCIPNRLTSLKVRRRIRSWDPTWTRTRTQATMSSLTR